jgi:hypothetical protein
MGTKYGVVLNTTMSGRVVVEGVARIGALCGPASMSRYYVRFAGDGSDIERYVEPANIKNTSAEAESLAAELRAKAQS